MDLLLKHNLKHTNFPNFFSFPTQQCPTHTLHLPPTDGRQNHSVIKIQRMDESRILKQIIEGSPQPPRLQRQVHHLQIAPDIVVPDHRAAQWSQGTGLTLRSNHHHTGGGKIGIPILHHVWGISDNGDPIAILCMADNLPPMLAISLERNAIEGVMVCRCNMPTDVSKGPAAVPT